MEVVCDPAFDYAMEEHEWRLVDDERLAADATGGGETVRLLGDIPLEIEGSAAIGTRDAQGGGAGVLVPVVA